MTDIGWTQEEIDQYNNEGYAKLAEAYRERWGKARKAIQKIEECHEARLDALQAGADPRAANEALRLAIDEAVALTELGE